MNIISIILSGWGISKFCFYLFIEFSQKSQKISLAFFTQKKNLKYFFHIDGDGNNIQHPSGILLCDSPSHYILVIRASNDQHICCFSKDNLSQAVLPISLIKQDTSCKENFLVLMATSNVALLSCVKIFSCDVFI